MPLKTNYRNISWNGLRKYQIIQNQDGTVSFLDVTEYTNVQDAKVLANDLNTNNDLVNRIMAGEFFYTEVETDALLAQKQNVLSFDNLPTANSGNPVRSDGIKYALDLINSRIDNLKVFAIYVCQSGEYDPDTLVPTIQNPDTETFYLVPSGTGSDVFTEWIYINNHWEIFGSSQIDMSNYVTVTDLQDALDDKQDVLTFDNVPTANSNNPVKSGGVKSALDGKSDTGHNHDDRYYTDSETDILLSGKSDTGHNHDDRYYTEQEVDTLLNGKRNVSDSYTKTEVDTLLSAKSDNIHNHDNRYYTETEVDTLVDDLQDQIDAINNFAIHICSSAEYDPDTLIPTIQNPSENTFYLVPDGSGDDMYNEWIYINNAWEKFGSTRIDLSQYYTKSQTDTLLALKAAANHDHDGRYYTESETDTLLAGKSDVGHDHDGTYLKLSGGVMSGTITLAETGLKTPNSDGYKTDQWGNFRHTSDNAANSWVIYNNAGSRVFAVNMEDGSISKIGDLNVPTGKFKLIPSDTANLNFASAYLRNSNQFGICYYRPGITGANVYLLPVVDTIAGNKYYNILTSKEPVTLAQGGTGGTDSGWVSITPTAANVASGTLQYRKVGVFVEIVGYDIKLANDLSARSVGLATLPSAIRPENRTPLSGSILRSDGTVNNYDPINVGIFNKYALNLTRPSWITKIETTHTIYLHGMYLLG